MDPASPVGLLLSTLLQRAAADDQSCSLCKQLDSFISDKPVIPSFIQKDR